MKVTKQMVDKLSTMIVEDLIKRYPIPAKGYPQLAKAEMSTADYYKLHFLYNINGENKIE